jgi:hypothetical protein
LQLIGSEISATMRKHQLKLADRQCRMSELSSRVQTLIVILATSLYAARRSDDVIRRAADGLCRTLTSRFTGRRASDRDFRHLTTLGADLAESKGGILTEGVIAPPIQMPYRD